MPNERRCGTCAKLEYYSDLLEGGLKVVYPECPHRDGVAEDDAACRLYEPLDVPGRGDANRIEAVLLVRVATTLSHDPDNGPQTVRFLVEEDLADLGYDADVSLVSGCAKAIEPMDERVPADARWWRCQACWGLGLTFTWALPVGVCACIAIAAWTIRLGVGGRG